MDSEKKIKREQEKAATEKLGATAGRAVADYYTGGKYETIRKAPVVGGLAKGAEKAVGKIAAKSPGSKRAGKFAKELDDAGVIDTADSALGAFGGSLGGGKVNPTDAQNLKDSMGKSSPNLRYGARIDPDAEEAVASSRPSSLGEKDGLKDKSESKSSVNEDSAKKQAAEHDRIEKLKRTAPRNQLRNQFDEKTGIAKLKKKLLALKITIRVAIFAAIALLGVILFIVIFSYLLLTIDNFFTSITTFFGLAEGNNSQNVEGLYTDERYYYDEDGNDLSAEDLVKDLHKDNSCSKITGWTKFIDWFHTKFSNRFSNPCQFIRYVKTKTSTEYNPDLHTDIDKGLIVGTIFYGFDAQTIDSIDEDNEKYSASDHFENLKNILSDSSNIITTETIDLIVKNSVLFKDYKYYSWEVTEEDVTEEVDGSSTEEGSEPETVTKRVKTAACVLHELPQYRYSLTKWKIFMRFGEEVADAYEKDGIDAYMYSNTSEECRGEKTIEELRQQISDPDVDEIIIDPSVQTAINIVEPKKNAPASLGNYDQKADVDSKTKDTFTPVGGLVLDYTNGFAYKNFPAYKEIYDDIYTAKEIETMIDEIVDRKFELNSVLLLDDLDSTDYVMLSSTGVIGAYCGDYLTASLDQIQVQVTDCDGNFIETVPFEEYIIGVANLEVSNTHDDYVMSEMLAAITFAFHRRGNASKGTIITMKSGNCDQAYCNMRKGCHAKTANLDCGGFSCTSYITGGSVGYNPGLYSKYQELYRNASQYLVVSNDSVFAMHYTSTNQNRWKDKAQAGMSFTQIIQEEYGSEGAQVIKCSEQSDSSSSGVSGSSARPHGDYDKVAPNLGKYSGFAYKYASGRNIEIDPQWTSQNLVRISISCGDATFARRSYTINKGAESNFKQALNSMCNMITNGIRLSDGSTCRYSASDFSRGEVQVSKRISENSEKVSLHAYGLAQDWNYDKTYTVNGVTYKPYGADRQESKYRDFVSALGKEEDCRNVNYIIWKYAYQPAGFKWGGNWKGSTFDGMHYEIAY